MLTFDDVTKVWSKASKAANVLLERIKEQTKVSSDGFPWQYGGLTLFNVNKYTSLDQQYFVVVGLKSLPKADMVSLSLLMKKHPDFTIWIGHTKNVNDWKYVADVNEWLLPKMRDMIGPKPGSFPGYIKTDPSTTWANRKSIEDFINVFSRFSNELKSGGLEHGILLAVKDLLNEVHAKRDKQLAEDKALEEAAAAISSQFEAFSASSDVEAFLKNMTEEDKTALDKIGASQA